MAHRYFTRDISGDLARITGPDAAHLARVLRVRPGEALTLCDGAGTDYQARVDAVSPDEISLAILSARPSTAEPGLRATACIAHAKGDRMDWAVQKAVELGAWAIQPFYSENCVVKPKNEEAKQARLARIALEAAKQAGRGIVPPVRPSLSFGEMLAEATGAGLSLFFYEGGGRPLRALLADKPPESLALITGPEGGFTPGEYAAAMEAGCVAVGLGPRILRCETAPAAALAAVMTLTGNME